MQFTVELFAHPVVSYYADLEWVRTPDDHTVVIRTHRGRRPDAFTVYYPEHLLGSRDPERLWEWDFWERPVGNGPFRIGRHVPGTLWELDANEDYFDGRPAIDRIRLRLGGGDPLVALLAGDVDVAEVNHDLLPGIEALATRATGEGSSYAAVFVQAALRNVGVHMDIRLLPDPPRREVHAGRFEVAFDPFPFDWPTWSRQLGSDNDLPQRLLSEAALIGDTAAIDALVRRTWPHFSSDVPVTFLGQSVDTFVVHRRIRGLSTPLRADPYVWARELRIEEEPSR